MTFDSSLTEENRDRVFTSVKQKYADIQKMAKVVVNKITEFKKVIDN